ncbi:preprotein translocase subunit SecG [bacterium]|nr:MAG: preprotein translocase subunit SecG [bacterium]
MLYTIIVILIAIVCLLLTLVVLLQNSDGSGMNAMVGGASAQMMGTRRTSDILSKSTTVLGTAFLVLCVVANFAIDKQAPSAIPAVQSTVPAMSAPADFSQPAESAPAVPAEDGGNTPAEGGN